MEYRLVIKTLFGLESILAEEVQKLGGKHVQAETRMVECKGDLGFVYKANYALRTALRILVPIFEFDFKDQNDFYSNLASFSWNEWLDHTKTFRVDATVNSYVFNNSQYVKLLSKDAIVDYFKSTTQQRPIIDKSSPDLFFHIYVKDHTAMVSVDSSGESLHKRGYRIASHQAPISEVLAAGLLQIAGWDGKGNLLDPMCGSGTILIEACMIATQTPPQVNREKFAFQKWPNYDEKLWQTIKETRLNKLIDFHGSITGIDVDCKSLDQAQRNITYAGLEDFISLKNQDFFDSQKTAAPLIIVCNPPYDERLAITNTMFYKKIGDTLKKKYPNTISWWLSADPMAWKEIGLKTSRKIPLMNGKLDCKYLQYITYEGSKKQKKDY